MMEPEKKYKHPHHECLNLRGKDHECLKCEIMARGFCNDFTDILEKMLSNLTNSYKAIPPEDRDEILSDTVIGVWKGIDKFEGRNGALFSTWSWAIFKNKRKDYFRRLSPEKVLTFLPLDDHQKKEEIEMMVSEKESSSSQDEEMEHIIQCLKRNIDNDPGGCIHLYLDLFCSGKDRKVLAQEYGLKLNTFNQRVRRCRKVIRDLCRG